MTRLTQFSPGSNDTRNTTSSPRRKNRLWYVVLFTRNRSPGSNVGTSLADRIAKASKTLLRMTYTVPAEYVSPTRMNRA